MGIFAFFVEWCGDLVGNFGWGIVLSMFIFAIVCSPLYFMQRAHRKHKQQLKPAVKEIHAKYHYTRIGFNTEDDATLPDDIRHMDVNQRGEAMSNELRQLYKDNHYRVYTGWIPGVLQYVLAILLYASIAEAAPEDSVYVQTAWSMITSGTVDWSSLTMKMLIILPSVELITSIFELLFGKSKKAVESLDIEDQQVKQKSAKIGTILSIVLPVGLAVFFAFRLMTATSIAFAALVTGRFLLVAGRALIQKYRNRPKAKDVSFT